MPECNIPYCYGPECCGGKVPKAPPTNKHVALLKNMGALLNDVAALGAGITVLGPDARTLGSIRRRVLKRLTEMGITPNEAVLLVPALRDTAQVTDVLRAAR